MATTKKNTMAICDEVFTAFLAGRRLLKTYDHSAHTFPLVCVSFKCGAVAATAAAIPRGSDAGAADVGVAASCC